MKLFLKMKSIFLLLIMSIIKLYKSTDNLNFEFEGNPLTFLMKNEYESENDNFDYLASSTQALPNTKPEEVPVPKKYPYLPKGYTFIFGVDDPQKDYTEPDRFDNYQVALLIYKNITQHEKVGRVVLDLREFLWKCGPMQSCKIEDLYSNMTNNNLDVNALKSQIQSFFVKISGVNKECIGNLYNDLNEQKLAVIFCFNSDSDLKAFELLFEAGNEKYMNIPGVGFDPETEQTFELEFTDGHQTLIKKKIDFKVDGMYENKKLLLKYEVLETFDSQRCNIAQNMPIVPIKFLESKIFSPKCVAKFKYNKIDTYIGSTEKNCAEIIHYAVQKMRNNCNAVKNGPGDKFKNDLVSRPWEGKWTGWVRFHKVVDNGGTINENSFKLIINPEFVEILDDKSALVEKLDYKNLIWGCNDDGDCTIHDYILYLVNFSKQNAKANDMALVIKQILEKWQLQDYNHCFVLEGNGIYLICTMDYSEEYAARLALSVSYDKNLVDAEANAFSPAKNGTSYRILHSTDTNLFLQDYDITVLPKGIKDQTGKMLVDYSKITPLKNIVCGFEFRYLSLPNIYHEIKPYCCARYFTDENNYICMQQQSKCYYIIRKLIQSMRSNCLLLHGSSNNATNPNPVNPVDPNFPDINNSNTTTLESWSGEVIYMEIDNYKFKGEANIQKGYFTIDANNVTYVSENRVMTSFELVSLNFICGTSLPCLPSEYERNQEPFLEKNYDRDWQQSSLNKYWQANSQINQNDCMVLVSLNTEYEASTMFLTCTIAPGQGSSMRIAVANAYNKKISMLQGAELEFNKIPPSTDSREYLTQLIVTENSVNANTINSAKTNLQMGKDGIIYKLSGETLFKYTDVIDYKQNLIGLKFNIKNEVPEDMIKAKVNPKCCFKAWTSAGAVFYICTLTGNKCYQDKSSMYRGIQSRAEKALTLLVSQFKRREIAVNTESDDPFDFGLGPEFRQFSSDFNVDSLTHETFDNNKNGIWEGWAYATSLTERNYNKIISLTWMQIGNGKISFKSDEDSPIPYEVLELNEYTQRCRDHCQPKEYLEKLGDKLKYDDKMYLEKTINNMLGQIKNAYVEEGCTILDFVSPIYQFGHSHIICGSDKAQGDKIREAIDNSYYQTLLDLDIEKQVRTPGRKTDNYFAHLIINDELSDKFNMFHIDDYGLVGKQMSLDPNNARLVSKEIFNLTYSDIADDNHGTSCSFYFRDLKIRERSPILNVTVQDNNCCFRFFTKSDKKKIDICTFISDGRICIENTRELMKGLKLGCLTQLKNAPTTSNNANEDKKDTQVDIYLAKTMDDHENGNFEGFGYFGNLLQSSQTPNSNPYFFKIHRDTIEFFQDHTKTENSTIAIAIEDLQFSCDGFFPCSPQEFFTMAQTSPTFMQSTTQIQTVFNIFKDTYSLGGNLDKQCLILETTKNPSILCAHIPQNTRSIKKSIVQAFINNHLARRLSAIPDAEGTTSYSVVYSKDDSTPKDDKIIVNVKGVFSNITSELIFDYREIDKDPITEKPCALWYKLVPMKFKFAHRECCFAFAVHGKMTTICVKESKVCIRDSFKLMKSIWNGCRFNAPTQSVIKPSPDSEILGETTWKPIIKFAIHHDDYDLCPALRNSTIFEKNSNDYNVDIYNDISFSLNKTLYKGWFNIYPVEINEDSSWSLLKYFGELTPEAFRFYESEHDKKNPKLLVRPDMLSMSCGKEFACKPMSFIDHLVTYNATLGYLKGAVQSKLDMYEIKKEDGCAVLENIVANIPNYFIICPHIRKTRTNNLEIQSVIDKPSSYSESRSLLSAYYGNIIRKIIYDSYLISRKYVNDYVLPLSGEYIKQAKLTLQGNNEHNKISINIEGVVSNSALIVKFDDLPHCRVRYNLIYAPEEVVYDKKPQCCIRYLGPVNHEYICFRDLNCEHSTFKFAKRFHKLCAERKRRIDDEIFNELNTGNNVKAMNLIKQVFKTELKHTNINKLYPTQSISTEEMQVKHKSLAIKFLFAIKDMMHSINVIDITSSKKLDTNPQDKTPADEITATVSEVSPRYTGESKEWEAITAKNRVTQFKHKTNGDIVTIIRGLQYIKTKEFFAIIGEQSEYAVLIYEDEGQKIFEISREGLLLTDSKENLGSSFKMVEPNLQATPILVVLK